ncbi:hypothetical protein ATX70_10120 [Oenococcus oeni]|nr:hypothetical protein ATX70_10120 [Oenococcus oeni]
MEKSDVSREKDNLSPGETSSEVGIFRPLRSRRFFCRKRPRIDRGNSKPVSNSLTLLLTKLFGIIKLYW